MPIVQTKGHFKNEMKPKLSANSLTFILNLYEWCIFTLKLKYIHKVEILLKLLDIIV